MRNKRLARVLYTHEVMTDKDGKQTLGPRIKGPEMPWGKRKQK